MTAPADEKWFLSEDGKWFWKASDGNWYPGERHPGGIPADVLERASPLADGTPGIAATARVGGAGPIVEPPAATPGDPWAAARRRPSESRSASAFPADAGPGAPVQQHPAVHQGPAAAQPATPMVHAAVVDMPEDETYVVNKYAFAAAVLVVALALLLPVPIAMATVKPPPVLTPGQAIAARLERLPVQPPALRTWLRTNAASIGVIEDDRNILSSSALRVADAQGKQGVPVLVQSCEQLYYDATQFEKAGQIPVPAIQVQFFTMLEKYVNASEECIKGVVDPKSFLLPAAADDSTAANQALQKLIDLLDAAVPKSSTAPG